MSNYKDKRKNFKVYKKGQPPAGQKIIKKKTYKKDKFIAFFTVLFIIIYLTYALLNFIITEDLTYVSATNGVISSTTKVQGVITRDEQVIYSDRSGYMEYFYTEGQKVPVNSRLARISDQYYGDILNNKIDKLNQEIKTSKDSPGTNNHSYIYGQINDNIENHLRTFSLNRSKYNFDEVYVLSGSLNKLLQERYETYVVENNKELQNILKEKEGYEQQLSETYDYIVSEKSGIICYAYDGYEDKQYQDITKDFLKDFEKETSKKISIELREVKEKEPLYKLITSQEWYLTLFLEEGTDYELGQVMEIKINDGKIITGEIVKLDQGKQGAILSLKLTDRVHEYMKDRVVTVTINETSIEGIKLPKSSIVDREFIGIPRSYIVNKKGVTGIIKKTEEEEIFVQTEIVYSDKEYFYILKNKSPLEVNQMIMPDTSKESNRQPYRIEHFISRKGVYIINKGYEEFKVIDTLYETGDYSIVANNSPKGVRLYDRVLINVQQ